MTRYKTFNEVLRMERQELADILRRLRPTSEGRDRETRIALSLVAMKAIACSDVDVKARKALSAWVMRWI